MDAASQYALAYSLTTAAGVRAVLSLALVSIAMHFGFLHPPSSFAWLASPLAMWILIGVGIVEMFADKIPVVDNLLHVAQTVVKPAAAAIIVGGAVHAQSNEMLIFLMVLGALNALGVHTGVAALRGASTVTTAGIANPAISTVEDVGTIGGVVASFFAPILMALVALALVVAIVLVTRRIVSRVRA